MLSDRFDLPLSTASRGAADSYAAALDRLLAADVGADALLDAALAADPGLALAHAARARLLQLQARAADAKAAIATAQGLAAGASARERGHVAALALAVEGRAAEALAAVRTHAAEFPRDALVLSLALGVYGLIGFSGARDHHERQRALLEGLAQHWGDHWWFLTWHGWSRVETGDVASGVAMIERGLALNPRNAHGVHARAHGHVEAGEADEGAAFVARFLETYAPDGQLHCHLSWHLALFALARGDASRAWAIYDRAIRPGRARSAPMPTLADGASFLWRWSIYGHGGAAADWREVADHAGRFFARPGLAFADLHAALAEAASGAAEAADARAAALDALGAAGRLDAGPVVALVSRAACAFAAGAYGEAATLLEQALADLPRIGGSHAQRELVEDTFIVACLRAGTGARAAPLLRARLARRPSRRDRAWLAAISPGGN
ncbi:MAG: tetratricopeptide repeat protein [Alphaproteobacteria bacterium]|nr:tetratricopeptide repeat protein [Alphaproteobacteria bacterium]